MITVKVLKNKQKSMSINPSLLIDKTVAEIIQEKSEEEKNINVISFDGKKVTYTSGEDSIFSIPEQELLDLSINEWVKKKLKSRTKLSVEVIKQSAKSKRSQ